jgi:tetratricopeptide (TPR) repeat protein
LNWIYKPGKALDGLLACLLVIVALTTYIPALGGQFIWDDDSWTTRIAGLLHHWRGLGAIFFQPTAMQQYYPLSGASFWLDYHLWGWWTLPYHIENVLLHALGALLFWKVLRRLAVPGAWLTAWIFALHPMMVESVAWITERKNVLSLPLFLGSALAYLRFSEATNGVATQDRVAVSPTTLHAPRSTLHYYLALVLFVAAYLAKASAFSLPAVLLLICWWKRGRIRWREDVLPLLPFFVLSLALSSLTVWVEKTHTGAQGRDWAFSFWERCLIAGRALWFYPGKLVWPVNLCFVYPRWHLDAGAVGQWIYPISALGMMLGVWLARNRIGRGPATAVFFYAGTLFPLLGFINGYGMRYSFVWDHWAYVSSLGLIALGCAGAVTLWKKVERSNQAFPFVISAVLITILGILSWRQSEMYRDMETLWRTTIAKNPGAAMVHDNLGLLLIQRGEVDNAIAQFRKAEELRPDDADTKNNLGNALLAKGQTDEAIAHFLKALELEPKSAPAHCNLGLALAQQGKLEEAAVHFNLAVQLQPDFTQARNNLGLLLLQKGQIDQAILEFQKTLEYDPRHAEAEFNLGNALLQKGYGDAAGAHFAKALQINPRYAEAHYNLALVLLQKGRVEETIAHFQKALEIRPDLVQARENLAALMQQRAGTQNPTTNAASEPRR